MLLHRFGYALYEPASFTRLHPGILGYLDEYRRWHPILDLTDIAAIKAAGYTPIDGLQMCEPETRVWGPLVSSNVRETNVKLEGDVDALGLGLPADIGGIVQFSTNTDFGAVLMCDNEVVAEGYDLRNPFLVWLKENSKALLKSYPDLKKHGVCAVTWTYSSTNIHINVWENAATTVTVGFKLGMTGVGHASPETSWVRRRSGSGWSNWSDQKRVVFFTGVKLAFSVFGSREVSEGRWRGAGDDFMVGELNSGEICEAKVEFVGDEWEQIKSDEYDDEDDEDD